MAKTIITPSERGLSEAALRELAYRKQARIDRIASEIKEELTGLSEDRRNEVISRRLAELHTGGSAER